MGDLLNRDKINDSLFAVADFLQSGGKHKTQRNEFLCSFRVLHPAPQEFEDDVEFECRDYLDNPSYILYSDSFKGIGYYRPLWSAYNLFSWNEAKGELSVELNGKTIILKHT